METFKALGIIKNVKKTSIPEIGSQLEELSLLLDKTNTKKEDVVSLLRTFIPEFDHLETGINLDSKM